MQNTGNLNSLAERMKAKMEQDRREMESQTRQQFDALSKSLSASSKNALNTTDDAIQHHFASLERNVTSRCRMLSAAFGWKCLQALVITLCILTGATFGGWGLMTLAGNKATALQREITTLSERKTALEIQSAALWATFKGLESYQADGKDYLLTPEGWKIIRAGTVGKREAWSIVRK